VNIPCIVRDSEEREDGIILSLSPYGAFVQMSHPPSPGKIHSIFFSLPESDHEILLDALPRWNRRKSEDNPDGSGFEFQGLAAEPFERIGRFVAMAGEKPVMKES